MLPESIGSLYSLLRSGGIDVILAGGWAVNEHGYSRVTRDVDWVVCEEQKDAASDLMHSAGFRAGSEGAMVTRFLPPSPTIPVVDLLWVDVRTFDKMNSGKTLRGSNQSIPVLQLEHLIAMKIHALKNHDDRKGLDLRDIHHLLEANPGVISDRALRELCATLGPEKAYELITRYD